MIYWAWNNLLSIMQQAYILKKQGTVIPLKDNLKPTLVSRAAIRVGRPERQTDPATDLIRDLRLG